MTGVIETAAPIEPPVDLDSRQKTNWRTHRRAGARWCPEHRKWECVKNSKRSKSPCHKSPILGTAACRMHSGKTGEAAAVRGQFNITAWSMAGVLDAPETEVKTISQTMAVKSILQMSWLRLSIIADLLRKQVEQEGLEADETDEQPTVGRPASSGLIGHRYSANESLGLYATSEDVRALVKLEADERDRVVKYAKTAHDMGIAEREQTAIEHRGNMMAAGLMWFLRRQGLDTNEQARDDLARMLVALDAGDLAQLEIGAG